MSAAEADSACLLAGPWHDSQACPTRPDSSAFQRSYEDFFRTRGKCPHGTPDTPLTRRTPVARGRLPCPLLRIADNSECAESDNRPNQEHTAITAHAFWLLKTENSVHGRYRNSRRDR